MMFAAGLFLSLGEKFGDKKTRRPATRKGWAAVMLQSSCPAIRR